MGVQSRKVKNCDLCRPNGVPSTFWGVIGKLHCPDATGFAMVNLHNLPTMAMETVAMEMIAATEMTRDLGVNPC